VARNDSRCGANSGRGASGQPGSSVADGSRRSSELILLSVPFPGARWLALVGSAAVGDLQDGNDRRVVVNLVEHPVITDADSEGAGFLNDGPYAVWPGIIRQVIDRGCYTFAVRFVQVG
jgi:hypothetical protein